MTPNRRVKALRNSVKAAALVSAIGLVAPVAVQADTNVVFGDANGTSTAATADPTSGVALGAGIDQTSGTAWNSNPDVTDFNGAKATGQGAIAVGMGAATQNSDGTLAGYAGIAIGVNATAFSGFTDPVNQYGPSTAIGFLASAEERDAISLGSQALTQNYAAIAIGAQSSASGVAAIAIGQNAQCAFDNSIAIGQDSTCSSPNQIALGDGSQTVSAGNLDVAGTLNVDGAATFNDGITVTGDSTFNDNVSVAGDLNVDGTTTTNGIDNTGNISTDTLNVSGQTTLANTQVNGTLGVTNGASIANGLTVTSGGAVVTGNSTFNNNLTVLGSTTTNGLTNNGLFTNNGNINNTGSLTVGGNTTLNGATNTINGTNTNINSRNITIGAANGSSVVSVPGIARSGSDRFVTVNSNGQISSSSRTISDYNNALESVDNQVSSVGAMAAALSAIPTLTTGDKNFACGVGTGAFGSAWAGALGCVGKVASNVWINGALSFTPSVSTDFGTTPSVGGRLGVFFQF